MQQIYYIEVLFYYYCLVELIRIYCDESPTVQ